MEKDHRQEIIENFNKNLIGLDDVFAFKCRECGKCCKQREDILLNSRDVYNIATALGMTHEQVIETHCEVYIGRDSRIPIVRLRPKGANRTCPLLVNNRCSVHLLKPTVCALFPLGRGMVSEYASEDMGVGIPGEIQYILNSTDCGSLKRKQTVRSWLEQFDISIEDSFFIKWNETMLTLVTAIHRFDGKNGVSNKLMSILWDEIFAALYIDYNPQKKFYPQFEGNVGKIIGIFTELMRLS